MLLYSKITESEGIDILEGIDVVRSDLESSKRCDICHFYFLKNRNFNSQPHGGVLHVQSITDLKIIMIKKATYRVVNNISYNNITHLLETSDNSLFVRSSCGFEVECRIHLTIKISSDKQDKSLLKVWLCRSKLFKLFQTFIFVFCFFY